MTGKLLSYNHQRENNINSIKNKPGKQINHKRTKKTQKSNLKEDI